MEFSAGLVKIQYRKTREIVENDFEILLQILSEVLRKNISC